MEPKQRNRILVVLFVGVLMGALDIAIVGPALPAIQTGFNLESERPLTWIFSLYVLFNLVSTPLMARLSDQYGRRRIYILDVSLFALGSLLVVAAYWLGFTWILVGRAIQGFGAGGIFPVASAVIGDTFPPEQRGRALGLIGMVFGLAFIVGPVLGGLLLGLGWYWLFLINLPIATVVIGLAMRTLPAQVLTRSAGFDWPGMVVLSLALASLSYGLNQIDTSAFFPSMISLKVLPFLIFAGLGFLVLTKIERQIENPILPFNVFNNRQLRLAFSLSVGGGIGEASMVFMPLLAVTALSGLTESSASYLLLPVVFAIAVGSPLIGGLLDRHGSRTVLVVGTLSFSAGVFFLSQLAGSLFWFILSGILIGLGLATLLGAPIRYIVLNEVNPADRSVGQGIITLFTSIGQLVGAAVVGAMIASRGGSLSGYSTAFVAITVVGLLLLTVAFRLKSREVELVGKVNQAQGENYQPAD